MASPLSLRPRLLLSIIRAPKLSQKQPQLCLANQLRQFHLIQPLHNEPFSITFGSRVDSLLATKRKRTKGVSGRSERKENTTRDGLRRSDTLAADDDIANDQQTWLSSKNDSALTSSTQHQTLGEEVITLELSHDAYDTTSKLERSGSEVRQPTIAISKVKSPKQSGIVQKERATSSRDQKHQTRVNSSDLVPKITLPRKKLSAWETQKLALKKKFGEEGWNPRKKLSPDAMEGIRGLHEQDPERYSTEMLSQQFKMSPEAIRRILKSRWRPSPEKMEERRERWARRHDRIWDQKAELGLLPPRTKDRRPEGPEAFEEEIRAKQMLGKL